MAPLVGRVEAPAALGLDAASLRALSAALGPLAVVDLETTGLADDPRAEILEVGLVLVDPGRDEVVVCETLLRPLRPVPPAITRLTGITDEMVATAPVLADVRDTLAKHLAGRVLVAHNADFEQRFLVRDVLPPGVAPRMLDTQDLLGVAHPDAPDLRLETFTRRLLGSEERHRALADALDAARVLSRAGVGARAGEARYRIAREALRRYAPDSAWTTLLAEEADGAAHLPDGDAAAGVGGARDPAAADTPWLAIGDSDEAPVPFDEAAIAAALRDEARGRRHFPGYRVREAQVDLALRFARNLQGGGVLLLEGGTGVGKSLAYLAAAIPYVMTRSRSERGGPVVISTRTKVLQDQLLQKDIAAAARFLGWPGLRAISIKGRGNYACARRLERTLAEGTEPRLFGEDRMAWAVLEACSRIRPHGELASLPLALLHRFPRLRELVQRAVSARAEQCSREQCAGRPDCAFGRRRAALVEAQLVVANHDLLLRWPPDYPAFAHAIADEAHELGGVADEVYALQVGPEEVLARIDEVFGRPGEARPRTLLPARERRESRRDALAWRRAVQQDLVALGRALAEHADDFYGIQVPEHPDARFDEAAEIAEAAARRLEEVADAIERLGPDAADATEKGPVGRAAQELRGWAGGLRQALAGGGADAVASFSDLAAPYDRWRCSVRPLSPAESFDAQFLSRLESFAGVSASLFIDGDAFAALGDLELEARSRDRLERASAPSPFPYRDHMRVVALASRGDVVAETAAVIEDLALRLGGRVLGLFTSRVRMNQVAERLAPRLVAAGIEVLTPRRASDDLAALLERFRQGGAVLLGSRAFWQGIDVPGTDLQAVVIEKLPFEVPTELLKRRERRLQQEGVRVFERYTLGRMLLHLKQMTGRLIRSEHDRGVVVIVEGRTEKNYFRRLREALPPGSHIDVVQPEDLARVLEEVGIAAAEAGAMPEPEG